MQELYGTFKPEEPLSSRELLGKLLIIKDSTKSGFNFGYRYHVDAHPGKDPQALAISGSGAIYRGQLRLELCAAPVKGKDPLENYFSGIDILEHSGWQGRGPTPEEQQQLDAYAAEVAAAFEKAMKGQWVSVKIKPMCRS